MSNVTLLLKKDLHEGLYLPHEYGHQSIAS